MVHLAAAGECEKYSIYSVPSPLRQTWTQTLMKIQNEGQRVCISELPELSTLNSVDFGKKFQAAALGAPSVIEIDLSETRFVDSSGVRALSALYRSWGQAAGVTLRLLNPRSEILQLLEHTRMHQLYEVHCR